MLLKNDRSRVGQECWQSVYSRSIYLSANISFSSPTLHRYFADNSPSIGRESVDSRCQYIGRVLSVFTVFSLLPIALKKKKIEKKTDILNEFGSISGLKLNVKKTKALWLGKWRNNRSTPLQLSWPRDPVKILGIYFSYGEKTNDHYNFNLKVQKLQTHLDMWSSRSLTLFGKVLIIKCLGLSKILYSASNISVPKDTT